ncbi:MAG: hypothetical protein OXC48_07435, partial [Endozoicomonadaceae bacterium]|nr:hypothetical protein [Endozoicomonadaceae bacterium]
QATCQDKSQHLKNVTKRQWNDRVISASVDKRKNFYYLIKNSKPEFVGDKFPGLFHVADKITNQTNGF